MTSSSPFILFVEYLSIVETLYGSWRSSDMFSELAFLHDIIGIHNTSSTLDG